MLLLVITTATATRRDVNPRFCAHDPRIKVDSSRHKQLNPGTKFPARTASVFPGFVTFTYMFPGFI